MRRFHMEVELASYSWQGRAGYTDVEGQGQVFSWNKVHLYGTTKPKEFPGLTCNFTIHCTADRAHLHLNSDRLEKLQRPDEQVRGVLSVTQRDWFDKPSVSATVCTDPDYVQQLNRHSEFAFINGVGTISLWLALFADEFPEISNKEDVDGIYSIDFFHFVYSPDGKRKIERSGEKE